MRFQPLHKNSRAMIPARRGTEYGEVQPRPVGKLAPEEPVEERVAGHNYPYRGMVDHGVPDNNGEPTDEAHYWTGRPVEYVENPDEEPVPIPVRVVRGETGREIKAFSTMQLPLNVGAPQQVAGRNERRSLLKIRNIVGSAGAVFIGNDPSLNAGMGYPLAAGEELTLTTTEPVYAFTNTAAVVVSVLWEFTKEYE
jgi:hypothetical protein